MPQPDTESDRPAAPSDMAGAEALFETSINPMVIVAPDGSVRSANAAWRSETGRELAEIAGRPWLQVLRPDDAGGLQARLDQGGMARGLFEVACESGGSRWFEGSAQRLEDGAILCLMRTITGDAARHIDPVDARDAHALWRLAGMAGWRWNPVDGICLSPEAEALFGYPPGAIRTVEDFSNLRHPDDCDRVTAQMARAVREGGEGTCEYRVLRADGRWLHIRCIYKTEPHPCGLHALQGVALDFTALAEAHEQAVRVEQQVRGLMEEARVSARRLKLALGAAQAGVFEIDHEAKTFWCSPEFVLLIGRQLTFREARAAPWPFVYEEDRQAVIEASEVWRTGTLMNEPIDIRVVRPDGAVRWMRLYYELRRDMRGRARRSVGLILDIDERKRQELALLEAQRAAEAAAEAKSHFLASMSHEIRTPMNGILGVLHLMKGENISAEGRRLMDEALACGQMLSELINDVLDLSKIEAGQMELHPEPADPAAILMGVASLLRPQAEAKGLYLTVDVPADAGWVEVDPVRVRQSLFNLVGNAVKFTVEGGVRLSLAYGDGRLRFEIADTGIGISQSARKHLFERFHQADSSTTRRFGGTGLGLAITRRLALIMGGDVGFTSTPGKGSTFWLEVAAPSAKPVDPRAADDVDGLGGLRVLVVEDNATNRLIVRKLLENLGAYVQEAEDGEAGVLAAARGGHDLILMDVQMPGMDGLQATRLIRAAEDPRRRMPIIALTANVLTHQKQGYYEAGMNGIVAKPVSPLALITEITRVASGEGLPEGATAAA